ncbi:GNAT family N-acetyltransferase [Streptomyces paludis]|uniref:GNAT family N-acetyltransferase n=1 Tax=Streptomyces paludis TaxID=2282738 RepID=A0A345HPV7_9ACTN|nr:GNAT family N-acetyltransferase [Streptomyces paludis]AXG78731.1 GNAT family N-acetyltransferase [Streptomyces paludis]
MSDSDSDNDRDHRDQVIRPVRPDEWARAKALRLVALQDPAAPLAFLETYEEAVARTDDYWRERAARPHVRQFVAEAPDGGWIGTVAVIVEEAGVKDFFGNVAERAQGHLVGVYVRPEHRGTGLIGALVRAALDWAWSVEDPRLDRVRLYVHEGNRRAHAAYLKLGFAPTGVGVPAEDDPRLRELELAIARP